MTARGKGHVTKFGYRRVRVPGDRRLRMEHVLVWERHHGPVPEGKELHHLDGDKLNNCVENLRLVTRLEHKRIHSGCLFRDGVWWKRCRGCGEFKPVTGFHTYRYSGVQGVCKPCCSWLAVYYKQLRTGKIVSEEVVRRLLESATQNTVAGGLNDQTPAGASRAGAVGGKGVGDATP
jgi:hypothetical protein